jgi:hypothetical protein
MRENRPYGLEGGETGSTGLPYPYQPVATSWLKQDLNSLLTFPMEQMPDKSITPIL